MKALLIAVALVLVMVAPASADNYPPTEPPCTDCTPTADTGFTEQNVNAVKVAGLLFVVGLGAVYIARRRVR
jgi:hypothetical protein